MYNNYRTHIATERNSIYNKISSLIKKHWTAEKPPINDLGISEDTIKNVLNGNYSLSTIFKLEILFNERIITPIAVSKNEKLPFTYNDTNKIKLIGGIGDLNPIFQDKLEALIYSLEDKFVYRSTRQYMSINYVDPNVEGIKNSIHVCFFKNFRNKVKLELNIPNKPENAISTTISFIDGKVGCKLKGINNSTPKKDLPPGFRYHIFQTPEELENSIPELISIFNQIKEIHLKSIEDSIANK